MRIAKHPFSIVALVTWIVAGVLFITAGVLLTRYIERQQRFRLTAANWSSNNAILVDCHPDPEPSFQRCIDRGCIWDERPATYDGQPMCYFPKKHGYIVHDVIGPEKVMLKKVRLPNEYRSISRPIVGLFVSWEYYGQDTVRIVIKDVSTDRFRPAVQLWPDSKNDNNSSRFIDRISSISSNLFVRVPGMDQHFTLTVTDSDEQNRTLFDTSIGGFVFNDQFIQIATWLPSTRMFGLGENVHQTLRHRFSSYQTWPLFSRDEVQLKNPTVAKNRHGVHPFFMCADHFGRFHGIFFLNSNAQEFTTMPAPAVVYRTIGGILDVFIFRGPSPADVLRQYWRVIGAPRLVPYWGLGFQLYQNFYTKKSDVVNQVTTMQRLGIPYEVHAFGIGHAFDPLDSLTTVHSFEELIHYFPLVKKRWMVTLTPTASLERHSIESTLDFLGDEYLPVMWPLSSETNHKEEKDEISKLKERFFVGTQRNGATALFINFENPDTRDKWRIYIGSFHTMLNFNGIILDMNVPTNHKYQYALPEEIEPLSNIPKPKPCPRNTLNEPPYATQAVYVHGQNARLSDNTICMSTLHSPSPDSNHYNLHNLFGLRMSQATAVVLAPVMVSTKVKFLKINMPVVSQSTFPGSGRFAGHSLARSSANWTDLKASVISVLEFNLFGIPYVGADICDLNNAMYEELCARWLQVGSFYPLARLRSEMGSFSPFLTNGWPLATRAARETLLLRYSYLPYIYTQFYRALFWNEPVLRPLFYEFPEDDETYAIDYQFMVGAGLLVIPVLEPKTSVIQGYFPKGTWYNVYEKGKIGQTVVSTSSLSSSYQQVNCLISGAVPLYAKEGFIYPRYRSPAMKFAEIEKQPFDLLIVVNQSMQSVGELFWAEDVNKPFVKDNTCYALYKFVYEFKSGNHSLNMRGRLLSCQAPQLVKLNPPPVTSFQILGVPFHRSVSEVTVDDFSVAVSTFFDKEYMRLDLNLSAAVHLEEITRFGAAGLTIVW